MSKKISFINEIIEKGNVENLRVSDDSTYYKAIRRWKEIPSSDKRRVALEIIKYAKENKLILRQPEILSFASGNDNIETTTDADKDINKQKTNKKLPKEKQEEIKNTISDKLEDDKVLNKILPTEIKNINNINDIKNINDKVDKIEEKLVSKNPSLFKNIAKILKDKIFHKVSEKDNSIKYCLQGKEDKNKKIYISYDADKKITKIILPSENNDNNIIEKKYFNITPEQFIKDNNLIDKYSVLEKDNNKYIELPEEITKININKDKVNNPEEQYTEASKKIEELKLKLQDLDIAFKQGESEEEAVKRTKMRDYDRLTYFTQLKDEITKLYDAQIQYFSNKNFPQKDIIKAEENKQKAINKYENLIKTSKAEIDGSEMNDLSTYDFQYNRLKGLTRAKLDKEALGSVKLKTKDFEKYKALSNDEVIRKYFPDYVQGSKDYNERLKERKSNI